VQSDLMHRLKRMVTGCGRLLPGITTPYKMGLRERPRNLIMIPEQADLKGGKRVALLARRLDAGLAASAGTLTAGAKGAGGALLLLSMDEDHVDYDRIRGAFGAFGVNKIDFKRGVSLSDGEILSYLRDFQPNIVVMPSPVEDGEVFSSFGSALGKMKGMRSLEVVLGYEFRQPLFPNLVVDVSRYFPVKEFMVELGREADLVLSLNHYRSITNMGGKGFCEAFFSFAPGEYRNGSRQSPNPMADLDRGPIPFFRGYGLLDSGLLKPWGEGEGDMCVLVLSPHYDDEAIGCGGTIVRHVRCGDRVAVLFFTDGREGDPREHDRDLVSLIRRGEALNADHVLGVERLEFLDQPETRLVPGPELERRVERIIEDIAPDIVYAPSFLENHIDHLELNHVLYRVFKKMAPKLEVRLFGVWTLIPGNIQVDITEEFDVKVRAVNAYRSQITQVDYLSTTMALNHYLAIRHGGTAGYAEVFRSMEVGDYCSVMEELRLNRGPLL